MAVYLIIEAKLKDRQKYTQYMSAFSDIISNYGGRCLVQGGRILQLDEDINLERRRLDRRQPERMVILEFPSEVNIRRCFSSPEYQSITSLRHAGAHTRTVLLDGLKFD